MQCVVLAGGLATRLRPLTEKVPKVLLEVGGKPFLDHQLTWFARRGVTEVVLCLGYLAEQVEAFAGDGSRWGLKVRYALDGPKALGTAGAVRQAIDRGLVADEFLLTWGDSFLPIDPERVFRRFQAARQPALMTVFRNEGRLDASNATLEGTRARYDKQGGAAQGWTYIDYGLLAFRREIFESRVPPGEAMDLAKLCGALSLEGQLAGDEAFLRFFEIGSPKGLEEGDAFFAAGGPPRGLLILDRDGVVDSMIPDGAGGEDSPQHPEQVKLLPGAAHAIRLLDDAGYTLVLASNQPAAAKGKTPRAVLEQVHARVLELAQSEGGKISSSHICWHRHEDGCACRKPKPGLLLEAKARWPHTDAADCWMVGDRVTDVEAGRAAGVRTAKIGAAANADWTGPSLESFARSLLTNRGFFERGNNP